jgi:hypothetical protein
VTCKEHAIFKTLVKALKAAKEHLEYCGYYERECARTEDLPNRIHNALQQASELKL